jgi:hypothetical protein
MRRPSTISFGIVATLLIARAADVGAQAVDSVTIGVDTRYRWRGLDRGDGVVIRGNVSLALAGFSMNRDAGERNNLTFDLHSWNPTTHRAARRAADQYEASLVYGRCLSACDQIQWIGRTVLEIAGSEYWLPDASAGPKSTPEIQATLRQLWDIERIGSRQVGIVLYPYVTAARDLHRYEATYAETGVGTSLGPMGALSFFTNAALAFSDWGDAPGVSTSFGYHNAELQLGVNHDMTALGRRHLSTVVAWDIQFPRAGNGATAGMLTARVKLSGPVLIIHQ